MELSKPEKTFILYECWGESLKIHAFNNGDGAMYHQIELNLNSDTGSSTSITFGCEAHFDPDNLALGMIAAQLNKSKNN